METGAELSGSRVEAKGTVIPVLFLSIEIIWWYLVVKLNICFTCHVCTHMYMLAYRFVVGSQRSTSDVFLNCFRPYCLRQCLSLNLELTNCLDGLAS